MISLLEVAERTQKGPKMDENDWNMGLFRKMNALARKYEIQYPKDGSWFNADESMVERAWQAALDFLVEDGVYCISTGRVVRFSEDEVKQAVREIPAQVVMGEGRDQRTVTKGKLDCQGPMFWRPGHHAPFTEDLAPLVVRNFATIGDPCYMEGFNFPAVDGREIHGLPLEAYAAKREIAWMREGVRKAGRPGMAVALYPISTRAAALIAPIDPVAGLRPTDGILLSILPDVKMEHDLLTAAIVYEDYGCFKVNGGGSAAIGGFCGGLEGAIVESVVKPIAGWLVYRDAITYAGVGHIGSTTGRTISVKPERAWATSLVCHTLNAKTNFAYWGGGAGGSSTGPGTETFLWEVALGAIGVPINGGHLAAPRQHRAAMNASQTPLEAIWALEVASAVRKANYTRNGVNHILEKIASKLEGQPHATGIDLRECWDLVTHQPTPAYREKYLRVKEELASWGLEFD